MKVVNTRKRPKPSRLTKELLELMELEEDGRRKTSRVDRDLGIDFGCSLKQFVGARERFSLEALRALVEPALARLEILSELTHAELEDDVLHVRVWTAAPATPLDFEIMKEEV